MNRFFWIINLTLLAAATAITLSVFFYAPTAGRGMMPANVTTMLSLEPGTDPHAAAAVEHGAEGNSANIEPIWQRSLFRPERREEEAVAEQNADSVLALPGNLELIGIGVLGNISAAIICAIEQPAVAARIDAFSGKDVASRQKGKSTSKRHVYKVGQAVGNSGFTVKSVSLDTVTLACGTQEQTLKLKKTPSGRAKGTFSGKTATGAAATKENRTAILRQPAEAVADGNKSYQPVNTDSPLTESAMPTSERIKRVRRADGRTATPLNTSGMDNNNQQQQKLEKMKFLSSSHS